MLLSRFYQAIHQGKRRDTQDIRASSCRFVDHFALLFEFSARAALAKFAGSQAGHALEGAEE